MDLQLREYAVKKINDTSNHRFLQSFLLAAALADEGDFQIIEPALKQISEKYPLKPQSIMEKINE